MDESVMGKREAATYVLAASIFSLAGALVYFAYHASLIGAQIPAIVDSIDDTADTVHPIVAEVAGIREQIPAILNEVEEVRKLVPPVLAEVKATRQTIPPILKESEQLRADLPEVLKSVNNVSWAVSQTNKQLKAYQPIVPEALEEIRLTREAIDPALDRVDVLIAKAGQAGREASEGAVTGVFTGILTAPFRMVGGIGTSITGLTQDEAKHFNETELAEYRKTAGELINSGTEGDSSEWKSSDSNARGKFTIMKIYTKDGRKCEVLKSEAWKNNKRVVNKTHDLCLNGNNEWELQKYDPED